MERSRVLVANWFNYPHYYDIAYQAHTRRDADPEEAARWTQWRGETKVTVTLRMLRTDLRHRLESLRVCLLVRRGSKELGLRHEFQLRTYTASQFRRLLSSVPSLELCNIC